MISVYTTGVFDLLHVGHVRILKRAAQLGDRLIVGVSTDELVCSYKHNAPVVPFEERIEVVRALRWVTEAVPQEDRNKVAAWESLKFQVWAVGDDWKGAPYYAEIEKELSSRGVRCVYLPYTRGVSTTIRRGLIEVSKGDRGFPTEVSP